VKPTDEMIHDIEEMREFAGEDNWDSYDAKAITEEEIAWAYSLVDQLPELDGVHFHFLPCSIELDWGPVNIWFTLDSFGRNGTGAYRSLDSHDPHKSEFKKLEKEEDGEVDIAECGQWFLECKQRYEQLFDDFIVEFEKHRDVKRIDKVLNLGSFKPFTYFVTMADTFEGISTGFIWQNFRAGNAFSHDPLKRSFFQCTQIIDVRTIPQGVRDDLLHGS
jgi:hypothetical protein